MRGEIRWDKVFGPGATVAPGLVLVSVLQKFMPAMPLVLVVFCLLLIGPVFGVTASDQWRVDKITPAFVECWYEG